VSSRRATYEPIQKTVDASKHRGVSANHYPEFREIETIDKVNLWVPFGCKNIINIIIKFFCFFFISSNRPSGLLRSLAISLKVSLKSSSWPSSFGDVVKLCLGSLDHCIRFICCNQFLLYCCKYCAVGVILSFPFFI
jgi:hypothetical protein